MKKKFFIIGFVLFILATLYCLYCFAVGRVPIGPQPEKYADTSGASVVSLLFGIACFIPAYFSYKGWVRNLPNEA